MANYKVRVVWQVVTEETVAAENVIEAQAKARKKAARKKPQATDIVDVQVSSIER
ncbi:MAG: hypothetical protein GF331_07060 [Chitinivibrionales bacterium]|nr:hypothetical protein [Chitinivibrionales bacterium]